MSNETMEASSADEQIEDANQPKRSHIHELFRKFVERQDVKYSLERTIKHKRAGLLKRAFLGETGFNISTNYVYRILNNQLPTIDTVTIGDHSYDILKA
jgi:hypothetical protein